MSPRSRPCRTSWPCIPSVPAKTVAEFIAYAKANPGKINYASGGLGTSVHVSGELFKQMTGVQMQHVTYRGAGPATIALLAGDQVHVMFDNLNSQINHIKEGRLRALGVTSAKRIPQLPDVPTVAETVPGYEANAFFGVSAPRNIPPAMLAKLNSEINAGLRDPKLKARIEDFGAEPSPLYARCVHQVRGQRGREVGEGAEGRRHQGGVTPPTA